MRSGGVRNELMQSRHGGILILILPFLSSFGYVSKAVYLLWLLRESLLPISSQKLLQVGERKKKKEKSNPPEIWCKEESQGFRDTEQLVTLTLRSANLSPGLGKAEQKLKGIFAK